MKPYVMTTGVVFGLVVLAHVWRVTAEPHLLRDPIFWVITLAAGALSAWAWLVLRRPA